jgi:hypothetical protein
MEIESEHVSSQEEESNIFSVNHLEYMRETIERMNKFNQIEVLRILHKHNDVVLNENKYGVLVNLTEMKNSVLEELNTYIHYVNKQETTLSEIEQQKESFKNIYFAKDNKDKNVISK